MRLSIPALLALTACGSLTPTVDMGPSGTDSAPVDEAETDADADADADSDTDADADADSDADTDADTDADSDADTDPGTPGPEDCANNVDDDGDGDVDADDPDCDGDGDGFVTAARGGNDCDDADPLVHTGATEVCNGYDDDCDTDIDDADPSVDATSGGSRSFVDGDGDGYGSPGTGQWFCVQPPGRTSNDTDCNDGAGSVHPGRPEVTCDGLDNDCAPATDDAPDGDGDGSSVCVDCDDGNAARAPGFGEACDGVDNDCNGVVPDTEVDIDGDGLSECQGDWDDPAVQYVIGSNLQPFNGPNRFRGNVFLATRNNHLYDYAWVLTVPPGGCYVDFFVHEATNVNGPWTVVWHDWITVPAGYWTVISPPVDIPTTVGRYYGLGVGWNACNIEYYRDNLNWVGVDAGIGEWQYYYASDTYTSYNPNYTNVAIVPGITSAYWSDLRVDP